MGWVFKIVKSYTKKFFNRWISQDIGNEILEHYTGDFEKIGDIFFGEHKRSTDMRFKNAKAHGTFFTKVDMDADADDSIFTGYIYNLNTLQFYGVNGPENGKRAGYKKDIVDIIGNKCFIPASE